MNPHDCAGAFVGQNRSQFRGVASEARPSPTRTRWTRLVSQSTAMRQLEAAVRQVAQFECTTLVTGETGCGKDEIVRAIHAAGHRKDKPFIAVNCGGLPALLAESQLFGHEKGSFTGAVDATRGAFRLAVGGVIFLDEIGEMALDLQPKLLQVLERREVVPVGATFPESIDVQVIAATNRDLETEVLEGRFRSDLLFRINTVHLRVPPLRERQDDIPRFIAHFSAHFAAQYGRPIWKPDATTLSRLVAYRWPGNVRQLAQTIQCIYVFADSVEQVLEDLLRSCATPPLVKYSVSDRQDHVPYRPAAKAPTPSAEPKTFNLKEIRRRTVRAAIAYTGGHFGRAARLLGVSTNTMTKLVAEVCPERSAAARRPRRPR